MDKSGQTIHRTINVLQSSERSSAFEVYRKPNYHETISPPDLFTTATIDSIYRDTVGYVLSMQESDYSEVMRHLKQQNALLMTLCGCLSDELITVQHKKNEIKTKIDNQILVAVNIEDDLSQLTVLKTA